MPKKRKQPKGKGKIEANCFVKNHVVLENVPETGFSSNPKCPHGPMICYEKSGTGIVEGTRYFACSAFRNAKECQQNAEGVVNKRSNSGLAQYMFSEETIQVFVDLIRNLSFKAVLCLGVSTVHERLLKLDGGFRSVLLDMDIDLVRKFRGSSCHYNMCNHYFFEDQKIYENLLKESNGKILLIMDPPFSAKPELLSAVHKLIEKDLKISSGMTVIDFNIIWIAPYFLEGHIKKSNNELEMSDYLVNYMDHVSFSDGAKSRKQGSPVRFFTNIPLSKITLQDSGYKFCKDCDKYVMTANRHCKICMTCTSKDGRTYEHCVKCGKCVKPTWVHCKTCNVCDHPDRHVCSSKVSRR